MAIVWIIVFMVMAGYVAYILISDAKIIFEAFHKTSVTVKAFILMGISLFPIISPDEKDTLSKMISVLSEAFLTTGLIGFVSNLMRQDKRRD